MKSMDVHPVAALFPMLADDELAELAEDIKQRGLLQPIVLDGEGRVLDGRNRLAACKLAEVEPEFTTYDGDDPDGYALAVNIARRHLTTGARAIIAAQAARLINLSKSGQARETGLSRQRIEDAATVLDWCDATMIRDVLAGAKPLSKAVEEARQLKREDADREAKKARLRDAAPDLLSLVDDERMSLDDAVAALAAREVKAREEEDARVKEERARELIESDRRSRVSSAFGSGLMQVWLALDPDPVAFFERTWDADSNPHADMPAARTVYTTAGLRQIAAHLVALAEHLDEIEGDLL